MAKCQDRWVDPLRDQTDTPIGPYVCGRQLGHPGVHALVGPDGSFAAWSEGVLLMAAQVGKSVAEGMLENLG